TQVFYRGDEARERRRLARQDVRPWAGQGGRRAPENGKSVHVSGIESTSGIAIACEGVSLTYSGKSGAPVRALQDVNVRIAPHKMTAVIGPSGCGKSTLLLIIRGLLRPSIVRVQF